MNNQENVNIVFEKIEIAEYCWQKTEKLKLKKNVPPTSTSLELVKTTGWLFMSK